MVVKLTPRQRTLRVTPKERSYRRSNPVAPREPMTEEDSLAYASLTWVGRVLGIAIVAAIALLIVLGITGS